MASCSSTEKQLTDKLTTLHITFLGEESERALREAQVRDLGPSRPRYGSDSSWNGNFVGSSRGSTPPRLIEETAGSWRYYFSPSVEWTISGQAVPAMHE